MISFVKFCSFNWKDLAELKIKSPSQTGGERAGYIRRVEIVEFLFCFEVAVVVVTGAGVELYVFLAARAV